jgi:hypothetical protein
MADDLPPMVPLPGSPSADTMYAVVAARRSQFDSLLWQVPVLSLTAQAFLFTIALDPDTTRFARTIASLLSLVVTFLTVQLLTRHRQAEITDAHILQSWEISAEVVTVHGTAWRDRRKEESADAGLFNPLADFPGYKTWATGLSLFGLAALAVLLVTWVQPSWLTGQ